MFDGCRNACQQELALSFFGIVAATDGTCSHNGARWYNSSAKYGGTENESTISDGDWLRHWPRLPVTKHLVFGRVIDIGLCQHSILLDDDAAGTSYLRIPPHKDTVAHCQDTTLSDADETVYADAHDAFDAPFAIKHQLCLACRCGMVLVRFAYDECVADGMFWQHYLASQGEPQLAIDLYGHTEDCSPAACKIVETACGTPIETKYVA